MVMTFTIILWLILFDPDSKWSNPKLVFSGLLDQYVLYGQIKNSGIKENIPTAATQHI